MRVRFFLALTSFLVFSLIRAAAQDIAGLEQGLKPYGSYHGGDIDSISMVNGALTVHIPLISYPQRGGKLHLGYSLVYNTPSLAARAGTTVCSSPSICFPAEIYYLPSSEGHTDLQVLPDFAPGVVSNYLNWQNPPICNSGNGETYDGGGCSPAEPVFSDYSVVEFDGANHHFGQTGTNSWISTDTTGYVLNTTVTAANTLVMTDRNGIQYTYMALPAPTEVTGSGTIQVGPARWGMLLKIEDTNGNFISANYTTSVVGGQTVYTQTGWTDTLGRTVPWESGAGSLPGLPGPNGGTSPFTVSVSDDSFSFPYAVGTACSTPAQALCAIQGYSNSVVQSVTLPDGTAYGFAYDPVTGALSQITLPTGGTISYTWTVAATCTGPAGINQNPTYSLVVKSRTVNANDGSGPHTWNYTYNTLTESNYPSSFQTVVTDPLGNDAVHTMTALGPGVCVNIYETELDEYAGAYTGGNMLEKTQTTYESTPDPYTLANTQEYNYLGGITGLAMNVAPISITTTDVASGKTSQVTKSYDTGIPIGSGSSRTVNAIYGDEIQEAQYDYGSGSRGPLLRTTNTSYLAFSGPNATEYLANNILSTPYTVQVLNGSGAQSSLTQYNYDEASPTSSGLTAAKQLDNSPPAGAYRGNDTSVLRWLNSGTMTCPNGQSGGSGSNVISKNRYFDTGTVYTVSDPCGDTTTYAYSPAYWDALATTVTNALGQSTSYAYDFNTGMKTSATDPNNQTTSYGYDSSWRLTSVTHPDGGLLTYCYSTSASAMCGGAVIAPSVLLKEEMNASQWESLEADVDGLGRKVRERVLSDPGGVDMTDITYDAKGRLESVSNSYRTTGDPTYGITTYQYDALDRKLFEYHPDNSFLAWVYSGNVVTSQDEIGNQWQRTTDALGLLTKVLEPNGFGPTPSMETDYTYDALGNLLTVVQSGASGVDTPRPTRTFTYDSLSRLLTAFNPENGIASYAYDPIGNVVNKTSPLVNATSGTQTIGYYYDALNRLLSKTYSDRSTPTSCYQYDSSLVLNGIGRMAASWTQTASGPPCPYTAPTSPTAFWTMRSILAYDPMGRIWNEQQFAPSNITNGASTSPCQNGTVYGIAYCYDLAGDLTSSTTGVGPAPASPPIIFTNSFDSAGRMQTVSSNYTNNSAFPAFLFSAPTGQSIPCTNSSSAQYTPSGALMNAIYGNGLTLNRAFDSRLRRTCEMDTGSLIVSPTSGSATVAITGAEQVQ